MPGRHTYEPSIEWTGNTGSGTSGYRDYERSHLVTAAGKQTIPGSSDPAFRGDPSCWNPEDLLVASVAQCHMLWFLHVCTTAGVVVERYRDRPIGTMVETADGSGRFERVVLRPEVVFADPGHASRAPELHEQAHRFCFIANSVNFPVLCMPSE